MEAEHSDELTVSLIEGWKDGPLGTCPREPKPHRELGACKGAWVPVPEENMLNLKDPDVREMADRNHTPEEVWMSDGRLMSVHCGQCWGNWPCPTRVALRELET